MDRSSNQDATADSIEYARPSIQGDRPEVRHHVSRPVVRWKYDEVRELLTERGWIDFDRIDLLSKPWWRRFPGTLGDPGPACMKQLQLRSRSSVDCQLA